MKKTDKHKGWRTCGAIGNPHGCRYVNGTILWKKGLAVFYETIHLIKDPMISYLDVYSRWIKTCIYTHTYNLNKNVHGSFIYNNPKLEIIQMSTNSSRLDKLWCGHTVGHHTAMKKNHHAQRQRWVSLKNMVTKECVPCNYIDIWGSGPDKINLWVAPWCPKHMPKPVRGDREASEGEKWAVLGARVTSDLLPSTSWPSGVDRAGAQ